MTKPRRIGIPLILVPALTLWIGALACADGPVINARPEDSDAIVERDLMIPVADGIRLAADVYRPARDGKPIAGRFPTLLQRTPYGKGAGASTEALYYAKRGYNVVMNDVRGRYKSEGVWRLIADDPKDGYDVVEWIAAQPWSDGKVGTFGTSYPGGVQHALAEMSPPHLVTMIPIDSVSNCAIGGMRQGGAFELRFMNWIFTIGAPAAQAALANPGLKAALEENGRMMRDHVFNLPVRPGNTPLRAVPEYEAWIVEAMRSGPESPFWKIKGMSVVDHLEDYKDVPVLHITGWYDSWTRSVSMNYQALSKTKKSRQRLIIGPWVHGSQTSNVSGETEFTPDAAIDLLGLRAHWYDHFMKSTANGLDAEPAVLIYVMGTGPDKKSPRGRLLHGGYWRAEDSWPLARAKTVVYHLREDRTLGSEPPGPAGGASTFVFDPNKPVPTVGGNISSGGGLLSNGGYDQRPRKDTVAAENELRLSERRDVLVFRTKPLERDTEVTGVVKVKLMISSSAPDTDFTAKLIDEIPPSADYPSGFDLNIADSILRCRYRNSLETPELMTPGRTYPITIELYPTSNVFKKGHAIRLDVSSSNFPRFDVNPNTGEPLGLHSRMVSAENSVHHSREHPSTVELSVIDSH